jgi:diaminohydroxyphosphoribosylaminopyrimidine deaminase / 5-amino-6-(5-phosphoribosylamino)uracil reductase
VADRRPRVTVKIAQTLDGRVATITGESQWITGPEARAAGHMLRAEHDAIMVGVGTVLADDPALTVRDAAGRDPMRVVLDSALRTPATARLFQSSEAGVVLACGEDAPTGPEAALIDAGAHVLRVAMEGGRVSLPAALAAIHDLGIRSVLVEGGPTVVTAFLRERLVERLAVFIAPMVMGAGTGAVGDLGVEHLADAIRGMVTGIERVGTDVLVRVDLPELED